MYAGIAILGYAASAPEPINMRAFSQLLAFIGHRYPKVILESSSVFYLEIDRFLFTIYFCCLLHGFSYFIFSVVDQIRKASAEQAYLVLLQNGNLVAEDKIEKALEIICETCWDGDADLAEHQRLELYETVGLEVGPLGKNSDGSSRKSSNKKPSDLDENASYSSLVESSGF